MRPLLLPFTLAFAAASLPVSHASDPVPAYERIAGGVRYEEECFDSASTCEHMFGETLAVVGKTIFVGGSWDVDNCAEGSEGWFPGLLSYDGITGTHRHTFPGSWEAVAFGERVLLNQMPPIWHHLPATDFGVRLVDPDTGATLGTYRSPDLRMPWNLRAMASLGDDFIALDGAHSYSPPESDDLYVGEDRRLVRIDGDSGAVVATFPLPSNAVVQTVAASDELVAVAVSEGTPGVFVFAPDGTPRWSRLGLLPEPSGGVGKPIALLRNDVVVGSPNPENGREAVYVLDGSTGLQLRSFSFPEDRTGRFGESVAARGGRLLVGAPYDVHPAYGFGAGTVFVIDVASGTIVEDLAPLHGHFSNFHWHAAWMGDAIVTASWRPYSGPCGSFDVFAPACRGDDPTRAEPCPPPSTSTTTSTTIPPAHCVAAGGDAACADGDLCTVDVCTESGCLWHTRTGSDAIRCVLDQRHSLPACETPAVPGRVVEAFARVDEQLEGVGSEPARADAILRRLRRARHAVRRAAKRNQMSEGCRKALLAIILRARAKTIVGR